MKKIIRLKTVIEMTGLSRSTIYDYIARKLFPRQITLGENSRGWLYSEVDEWLDLRIQKRDEQDYDD